MLFIQNYIHYHIYSSPPPPPHLPQLHCDLDFKVIALFFYLIDKHEFRRAILSGDRSCLNNTTETKEVMWTNWKEILFT